MEHNYEGDVVSIRDGGIVPRVPLKSIENDDLEGEAEQDLGEELSGEDKDEPGSSVFLKIASESSAHATEPSTEEDATAASVTSTLSDTASTIKGKLAGTSFTTYETIKSASVLFSR